LGGEIGVGVDVFHFFAQNSQALQYIRFDPSGVSREDVLKAVKTSQAEGWWILLKNEWIDTGEFRLD
jgi:hypothetical protein